MMPGVAATTSTSDNEQGHVAGAAKASGREEDIPARGRAAAFGTLYIGDHTTAKETDMTNEF